MASASEKVDGMGDLQVAYIEQRGEALTDVERDLDSVEDDKIPFKTKLAVLTLIIMYESYLFTLQMPGAILSYINADLGPDTRYSWIAISWNLGAAVIVTIGSRLSDIMGRRWFLIFGATAGAVGALVGATSQSISQSIASGIIFGVGGGFQEMCFACAQELVPKKYRFKTLGFMILANHFSASSVLIGYAFVAYTKPGWRTVYWWCFAWELLAAILLFFCYYPPSFETKHKDDHKTKLQLLKEIDYVGLLLFTAGCVLILLGVNWGGTMHPWKSSWTIGTIAVGGVCLIALGFWETYMPLNYPILPPHLFVEWRKFTSIVVVCFVLGMAYYSINVIWPLQSTLLFVPANKTIIRGVYASMGGYGVILAGYYCVIFMHRLKHEKLQMISLLCIMTALIGSMASIGIHDKGQAIATVVLIQATNLPTNPLSFGIAGMHLKDQTDIGVAVGLLSTFRLIGGAIATAIYTAIQTNKFASTLPSKVVSAATDSNFKGSLADLLNAAKTNTASAYAAVPGITNQTIAATELAVKQAHVSGYALTYIVAVPFGVAAILSALTVQDVEESERTSEVAAKLENIDNGRLVKKGVEKTSY